jgi:predicted aldo/keto reductase-like oxidoreductase
MKYSILGKTGLKVPLLGFGGIPIQRATREAAIATLHKCLEKGITFFDTARGYSDSEEKISAALKGVPRDGYILACKTMARTGADMARDIDISLKTLGVDYIDLYQCHNVRYDADEEVLFAPGGGMDALLQAKEAGKIGHIGVTGHQVERLAKLIRTGRFETVQVPYNFNEDKPEKELLPAAAEEKVGVIAMKPLGGGALPPDLALRFFLDKPVGVVIAGVESPEMVEQNYRSITEGGPLSQAEAEQIREISSRLGQSYCRRCDYCQPCPQGIDISRIFILYRYFADYGLPDWALAQYGALKVGGDVCEQCGQCAARCPYSLPIPEMIKKYAKEMAAGRINE